MVVGLPRICLLLCNFPDLFALGVLMWEVFSEGKIPYENRTNAEVVEEINAGFRLYKPRLASKAIYEVMSHCWKMVSIVMGEPLFPKTSQFPWLLGGEGGIHFTRQHNIKSWG